MGKRGVVLFLGFLGFILSFPAIQWFKYNGDKAVDSYVEFCRKTSEALTANKDVAADGVLTRMVEGLNSSTNDFKAAGVFTRARLFTSARALLERKLYFFGSTVGIVVATKDDIPAEFQAQFGEIETAISKNFAEFLKDDNAKSSWNQFVGNQKNLKSAQQAAQDGLAGALTLFVKERK